MQRWSLVADLHRDAPISPGSERGPVADEAAVRALLRAQLPRLADEPLVPGPTGWDNVHWMLRDGDRWLAVRLPRRELAVGLVANEALVLSRVADQLPLAVPTPVHLGEPVDGVWPWPWSVVPWLRGERADLAYPPVDPEQHAEALGGFLGALHTPADADAPANSLRGVPLAVRAERTEATLRRLSEGGRVAERWIGAIREAWEAGLAATVHAGPSLWLHGDLHPGNQLVDDGALTAIVDWGDATSGDPAADLATAWWTLPTSAYTSLRTAYGGIDDTTWTRARGWAAAITAFVLEDGPATNDQAILAVAHRSMERLCEG